MQLDTVYVSAHASLSLSSLLSLHPRTIPFPGYPLFKPIIHVSRLFDNTHAEEGDVIYTERALHRHALSRCYPGRLDGRGACQSNTNTV